MSNNPTVPLTFYPAYCFTLSPTYNTWARLTVSDVLALKEREGFEGQNLFFHLNHPIRWIRLVGLVVTFDIYPTRFIMILDDSSGSTIEITCGRRTPPSKSDGLDIVPMKHLEPDTKGLTATGYDIDLHGVDIGSVVKVKGGIGDFRAQRQVLLERISIMRTTTMEAAAWAENTAFRRDLLSHPWTVSEEEHAAVKRKAEGLDRKLKKKKMKRRKASEHGGKGTVKATVVKDPQSSENLRKREDAARRWKGEQARERAEEQDREQKEKEVMKKIEQEDADRRRKEETVSKMKEEQESRRREEEQKKRREAEEQERLATERRRLNETREKVLREMGAGR